MEKVFILPLDTFPSETDKVIWINYPELPSHDFRWISLDRLAGFVPKDRTAYVSVVQARKVKLYGQYWWRVTLDVNESCDIKMHPEFLVTKKEE
jgi:hypothetical protein